MLNVIPAHASEYGTIRVFYLTLRLVVTSGLEPLQLLIVADGEDEAFGGNDQDLNNTVTMDQILLRVQSEHALPAISPILKCLEDVKATFTITREDLQGFSALPHIERCQPDIGLGS